MNLNETFAESPEMVVPFWSILFALNLYVLRLNGDADAYPTDVDAGSSWVSNIVSNIEENALGSVPVTVLPPPARMVGVFPY